MSAVAAAAAEHFSALSDQRLRDEIIRKSYVLFCFSMIGGGSGFSLVEM